MGCDREKVDFKLNEHVVIESFFHCSAEWHLRQMKSNFAAILYSWARRLTRNSGVFSASVTSVSHYFGVDRKTVLRALGELTRLGLFELKRRARFRPNVYRIIDHKEWAARHPGLCVEKAALPWDGEGDPLGRQLFAISGQRVKFLPNQMTGLRRLGFSDPEITELFRSFIGEANYPDSEWSRAYYEFYARLKNLAEARASSTEYRSESHRIPPIADERVLSPSVTKTPSRYPSIRNKPGS